MTLSRQVCSECLLKIGWSNRAPIEPNDACKVCQPVYRFAPPGRRLRALCGSRSVRLGPLRVARRGRFNVNAIRPQVGGGRPSSACSNVHSVASSMAARPGPVHFSSIQSGSGAANCAPLGRRVGVRSARRRRPRVWFA